MSSFKEKWRRLSYEDLAMVFSEDEIEKLDQMSLSSNISAICQQQLDVAADAFRSAFRTKGWTIDVRQHYLPNGYVGFVLNYARPAIASRFPDSKSSFIDEIRKDLYEEAVEILKNPTIGTPTPDYSDDPELSNMTEPDDIALTLPYLRIPSKIGAYGFTAPYVKDYQISGYCW